MKSYPTRFEPIPAADEIVARERDVLDAFALVFAQILFDLANLLGLLLVQWDADQTIRRGQCSRDQTGVLALDVEVANLTEVEEVLIVGAQ